MTAAEFKVMFDHATADWDEPTKEECREMIRKDWVDGEGYSRENVIIDRDERRALWINWFKNLRVTANGINERLKASIEAERENNRAGAQVDV